MCLVSTIPVDTSGSIGVNKRKLSLLIKIISISLSLMNVFCNFLRTSIPANPLPKIIIRSHFAKCVVLFLLKLIFPYRPQHTFKILEGSIVVLISVISNVISMLSKDLHKKT